MFLPTVFSPETTTLLFSRPVVNTVVEFQCMFVNAFYGLAQSNKDVFECVRGRFVEECYQILSHTIDAYYM